jgi:hypothetical protein
MIIISDNVNINYPLQENYLQHLRAGLIFFGELNEVR